MSARTVVDPSKAASKQLLDAVDAVMVALGKLRRVKAAQDMMMNSDDGSQAATEYGVTGAATGAAICNIVGTALGAFDVSAVQALSKLDQG